jgi:flagellar basal body rod protein FlgG
MLESPEGGADRLLTRAGAFARDAAGRLVLATSGTAVLGEDGKPIVLSDDLASVRIDARGRVFQGESEIGKLALVTPDSTANLRKEGRDAIRLLGGRTNDASADASVHQGHVEESTVDPVAALAELVKVSRSLEFSTRLMQTQDQMTGRLIDTFGRFS